MHLPEYQGRSIVNLMASLQTGLDGRAHDYPHLPLLSPEQVRSHGQVLLLVIDGLGLNYLRAHPEAKWLNAHLLGGITSVFPPTTASAIPTFLSGEAPQQHGLTGWHMYFRELGSVLAVLPGRARYGGNGLSDAGINVQSLLQPSPLADRIGVESYSISPAFIAESDFNRAYLGDAHLVSYRDLSDLMKRCGDLLHTPGSKYLYAYWPQLDSIGHQLGIWSEAARGHLLELDRAFKQLLDSVRGTDTLVVVCADHGQIDSPQSHRIDLAEHPALNDCLVLPLCGEPRSAYCYLRPGCENEFDSYVRTELAEIAVSLPSASLIEQGWFGHNKPHPHLLNRIGDRVLVVKDDYAIKDWLPQETRYEMIGIHGGLSLDELWVPLILAES